MSPIPLERSLDKLSPARRSENMRRIRSRDTEPELTVRRFLHSLGLRYRLHRKDLPGRPDIVLASRHACVFVHGCFWHGCPRCIDGTRRVKSNTRYWTAKILGNRDRDRRHRAALRRAGWIVFTVWECEAKDGRTLARLGRALGKLQPGQSLCERRAELALRGKTADG